MTVNMFTQVYVNHLNHNTFITAIIVCGRKVPRQGLQMDEGFHLKLCQWTKGSTSEPILKLGAAGLYVKCLLQPEDN